MSKREFHIENEHEYDQSTPLRWIIAHILRYKPFLLSFLLGITLTNTLNSAIPTLTGEAFSVVLEGGEGANGRLLSIALLILTAVVFRVVSDAGGQFSMEVIAKRLERDARDELYLNLLGKSQTFHNRQRVGDIMARANNDVREMNNMMMPGVALLGDSMMGLVMPILFIGLLKPVLLITPLLFVVAYYFALKHYMEQLTPVSGAMRQSFGVMNAGLTEAITGIEVVKTAAQEWQETKKFVMNASIYREHFVKNGEVQARYLPLLLLGVALAFGFLHGLILFSQGSLSLGDFVAFMGLMFLLRFPSFISIFTFALVQLGLAGAERILALMKEETEIDENTDGYNQPMRGEILFENVTFGYDAEKPILKNVSFRAAPGQTVAIVGQTGSGKSTLTKLVNRTYDVVPSQGRICIDSVDVRRWQLDSLRSQISTIEQDIVLFSRSVADNIAFGLGKDAAPDLIEQAAREAQAHDFIMNFKDGYETVVGERGTTLSGGQRQRLAIARALLTDPRILILDDATSAIDSATEDRIQTAINRILSGRTTLMITHRLSQIRRADKILVLRQGEVIDQGGHEELLARCELYQKIFGRREALEVGD
ncbi:MAG: ABC transporter ATP-binding protein [Chloroflexota bacterium]